MAEGCLDQTSKPEIGAAGALVPDADAACLWEVKFFCGNFNFNWETGVITVKLVAAERFFGPDSHSDVEPASGNWTTYQASDLLLPEEEYGFCISALILEIITSWPDKKGYEQHYHLDGL